MKRIIEKIISKKEKEVYEKDKALAIELLQSKNTKEALKFIINNENEFVKNINLVNNALYWFQFNDEELDYIISLASNSLYKYRCSSVVVIEHQHPSEEWINKNIYLYDGFYELLLKRRIFSDEFLEKHTKLFKRYTKTICRFQNLSEKNIIKNKTIYKLSDLIDGNQKITENIIKEYMKLKNKISTNDADYLLDMFEKGKISLSKYTRDYLKDITY